MSIGLIALMPIAVLLGYLCWQLVRKANPRGPDHGGATFRTVRLDIAPAARATREPLGSSAETVAAGIAIVADSMAVVGATAVADRQSPETTKTPAGSRFPCSGHSCPTDMLGLILPYVQVSGGYSGWCVSRDALPAALLPAGVRPVWAAATVRV
ncbi:Uncharacterised protein [Mycobacteroides abscessus subsp. bolletii]|nr:Uncharacterised protein [Mycobacteroides abscessus subsp. bolletii]SKS85091.1 Uncharacterised protein [Mycobacteroides abscessus subsp. bolletii]